MTFRRNEEPASGCPPRRECGLLITVIVCSENIFSRKVINVKKKTPSKSDDQREEHSRNMF